MRATTFSKTVTSFLGSTATAPANRRQPRTVGTREPSSRRTEPDPTEPHANPTLTPRRHLPPTLTRYLRDPHPPVLHKRTGTLTGVFVLTGLGIGACAGVVASGAGTGGVIRSAGIGAVAGAAASVHILDLGRLLLRGQSIAGAQDTRAARQTRVDAVSQRVGGRAARVRTALRARSLSRHENAHISSAMRSIERALLGGDVELVLNQLLTGMVESPNSVHTGVIDPSTGGFNSLSHSSSSSDVTDQSRGGSIETDQSQAHIRQLLEAMLLQANVEDMSYEELLDRFGPGIEGPAAAPAAAVRAVPRRRLTGEDVETLNGKEARSTERACCVCLEDYGKGDTVKTLPRCGHRFHAHCIDRWLLCRNACPVCRVGLEVPATEGPPGPAAAAP